MCSLTVKSNDAAAIRASRSVDPFLTVRTLSARRPQDQKSLMTFEGQQLMGKAKIIEKLTSLGFQTIKHIVTQVDAQPTFDNGIVVSVLGQLKTDDDHPHTFNQVFIIKQENGTCYVEHDIFRLALHI